MQRFPYAIYFTLYRALYHHRKELMVETTVYREKLTEEVTGQLSVDALLAGNTTTCWVESSETKINNLTYKSVILSLSNELPFFSLHTPEFHFIANKIDEELFSNSAAHFYTHLILVLNDLGCRVLVYNPITQYIEEAQPLHSLIQSPELLKSTTHTPLSDEKIKELAFQQHQIAEDKCIVFSSNTLEGLYSQVFLKQTLEYLYSQITLQPPSSEVKFDLVKTIDCNLNYYFTSSLTASKQPKVTNNTDTLMQDALNEVIIANSGTVHDTTHEQFSHIEEPFIDLSNCKYFTYYIDEMMQVDLNDFICKLPSTLEGLNLYIAHWDATNDLQTFLNNLFLKCQHLYSFSFQTDWPVCGYQLTLPHSLRHLTLTNENDPTLVTLHNTSQLVSLNLKSIVLNASSNPNTFKQLEALKIKNDFPNLAATLSNMPKLTVLFLQFHHCLFDDNFFSQLHLPQLKSLFISQDTFVSDVAQQRFPQLQTLFVPCEKIGHFQQLSIRNLFTAENSESGIDQITTVMSSVKFLSLKSSPGLLSKLLEKMPNIENLDISFKPVDRNNRYRLSFPPTLEFLRANKISTIELVQPSVSNLKGVIAYNPTDSHLNKRLLHCFQTAEYLFFKLQYAPIEAFSSDDLRAICPRLRHQKIRYISPYILGHDTPQYEQASYSTHMESLDDPSRTFNVLQTLTSLDGSNTVSVSMYRKKIFPQIDYSDQEIYQIPYPFEIILDSLTPYYEAVWSNRAPEKHLSDYIKGKQVFYFLPNTWLAFDSYQFGEKLISVYCETIPKEKVNVSYSAVTGFYYVSIHNEGNHNVFKTPHKFEFILKKSPLTLEAADRQLINHYLGKTVMDMGSYDMTSPIQFPPNANAEQKIRALIRQKKGVCEQRVVIFMYIWQQLQHNKQIPEYLFARIVKNDCHAFIEIGNKKSGIIESLNLGGGFLSKINPHSVDTLYEKSLPEVPHSADLCDALFDEYDEEMPDENAFDIPLFREHTLPAFHPSLLYFKGFTKGLKQCLIEMHCDEEAFSLCQTIGKKALKENAAIMYCNQVRQLRWHSAHLNEEGRLIKRQGGEFYDLTQQKKFKILLLNTTAFETSDYATINSLLETPRHLDGLPVSSDILIIVIQNIHHPQAYRGNDFLSRLPRRFDGNSQFMKFPDLIRDHPIPQGTPSAGSKPSEQACASGEFLQSPTPCTKPDETKDDLSRKEAALPSVSSKSDFVKPPSPEAPEQAPIFLSRQINLYQSRHWRSKLLGYFLFNAHGFSRRDHPWMLSKQPVVLQLNHTPTDDLEFQLFYWAYQCQKEYYFAGHRYNLSRLKLHIENEKIIWNESYVRASKWHIVQSLSDVAANIDFCVSRETLQSLYEGVNLTAEGLKYTPGLLRSYHSMSTASIENLVTNPHRPKDIGRAGLFINVSLSAMEWLELLDHLADLNIPAQFFITKAIILPDTLFPLITFQKNENTLEVSSADALFSPHGSSSSAFPHFIATKKEPSSLAFQNGQQEALSPSAVWDDSKQCQFFYTSQPNASLLKDADLSITVDEKTNICQLIYQSEIHFSEEHGLRILYQVSDIFKRLLNEKITLVIKGCISSGLTNYFSTLLLDAPFLIIHGEKVKPTGRVILLSSHEDALSGLPYSIYRCENIIMRNDILLEKITSDITYASFIHNRVELFEQAIDQFKAFVIEGETGIGKSTLIARLQASHPEYDLYMGKEALFAWITEPVEPGHLKILCLDEANTFDENWVPLIDWLEKGYINFRGKLYQDLPSQQMRVILISNPLGYGGERNLPMIYTHPACGRLLLSPIPASALLEEKINRYLSALSLPVETFYLITHHFLKKYLEIQQASTTAITPRDLETICCMYVALIKEQVSKVSPSYLIDCGKNLLHFYTAHLQPSLNHTTIPSLDKNFQMPPASDTFIFLPEHRDILCALELFIHIRRQAMYSGIRRFTLEGPSGIGKSTLIQHYLNAKGFVQRKLQDHLSSSPYDYYVLGINAGLSEQQAILQQAQKEHAIILFEESNTHLLPEAFINDLLGSESQLLIIGTQNPPSYPGRHEGTKAQNRREFKMSMPMYSLESLIQLIQHHCPGIRNAKSLANAYLNASKTTKNKEAHLLTIREFIEKIKKQTAAIPSIEKRTYEGFFTDDRKDKRSRIDQAEEDLIRSWFSSDCTAAR